MAQRKRRSPKPPGWQEAQRRRREQRACEQRLEQAVNEALNGPELAEVREAIFGNRQEEGADGRR